MDLYLQIANLIILLILVVLLVKQKAPQTDSSLNTLKFDSFEKALVDTERTVKEEIAQSREEFGRLAGEQRQELSTSFITLSETVVQRITENSDRQKEQLKNFSEQLITFADKSGMRLDAHRDEGAKNAKLLREEVNKMIKDISETISETMSGMTTTQKNQFTEFSDQLSTFEKENASKLDEIRKESFSSAKELREEVVKTLSSISDTNTKTMKSLSSEQEKSLLSISSELTKLTASIDKKIEAVRATVEGKLQSLQEDNTRQLDKMRQTVDEKLQSTLERRLCESFKLVSDRLDQVHKGLGEMQTLAKGVGDLKKVLSNVKTRGTWGEVQLGNLLEEVLTQDQFSSNVAIKNGTVEFAVKLPGRNKDNSDIVWLPIDAKFPLEDFQRLVDAQEKVEIDEIDIAAKQLEVRVKNCAKDICSKYIDPPTTTDFGILFLPIEGLYAEIIRRPGLTDMIQREYRVVIAGPTTLWSILNSLQMGFRTLAIEKRSSEVWNILSAVKTEWTNYGAALDLVQKRINSASDSIDKAQRRTRVIGRKLKDVEELPITQAALILPPSNSDPDSAAQVVE